MNLVTLHRCEATQCILNVKVQHSGWCNGMHQTRHYAIKTDSSMRNWLSCIIPAPLLWCHEVLLSNIIMRQHWADTGVLHSLSFLSHIPQFYPFSISCLNTHECYISPPFSSQIRALQYVTVALFVRWSEYKYFFFFFNLKSLKTNYWSQPHVAIRRTTVFGASTLASILRTGQWHRNRLYLVDSLQRWRETGIGGHWSNPRTRHHLWGACSN